MKKQKVCGKDLVAVLLGPVTPLTLRNALGRVLGRCIARHSSLQPRAQSPREKDMMRTRLKGLGKPL